VTIPKPEPTTPAIDRGLGRDRDALVVMPWLVRLRWGALVALGLAGWAAQTLWHVQLPVLSLLLLLGAMAGTNAALAWQLRSPSPRRGIVAGVLVLDVALLTAILYLVGGPLNPFSIVYLVGVTIAAVALGHRWALAIAVLTNAAYGLTFFRNRPIEFFEPGYADRLLTLHLSGMWVALAAAGALIAYFVGRVSEALALRERELADARAAAARSERLAALLALGAGAAHELATPLSTIATAVNELERSIAGADSSQAVQAKAFAGVIRREVDRCTGVLDQLSGRAASASAEDLVVMLPQLVEDLQQRLGDSLARRLDVALPPAVRPVAAPAEPLRQTLIALIRNAFDASLPDQRVLLRIEQDDHVRMEVTDRGRGMSAEESARAGEPFYTTKGPGAGLGLGLYLARGFAEQMGGTLTWQSTPNQGTSVVLDLPVR